jgi:hypothetical protein
MPFYDCVFHTFNYYYQLGKQMNKSKDILHESPTFAERNFGHLLKQPWDPDFLPPNVKDLPGELAQRFSLPEEVCGLAVLSFASAHLGGAPRLGDKGTWGMSLNNLRFAIGVDCERNLNPLFRTLGNRLYRTETGGFDMYALNQGKPPTSEERAKQAQRFLGEMRQIRKQENRSIDSSSVLVEELRGRTMPNVLLPDDSADSWLDMVAESDGNLFSTGWRGDAICKYLTGGMNPAKKEVFLKLMKKGYLEEPLKEKIGRRSWAFVDSCSIGAFWVMPSPFLRKALTDERMIADGFWESFFVMESELGESTTRERRTMPLNALPKWEETVAQLHSAALSMGNDSLSVQKPAEAVFEQFAEEMNGALEKVPENSKSFLLRWPTLAEKIAGVLHMIDYASHLAPVNVDHAHRATKMARWLAARTLQMQQSAVASQHSSENLREEETMLRKLSEKGPVNFQTLRRSYRKQAKILHEPTLESLQRKGVVEIDDDKVIRLVA